MLKISIISPVIFWANTAPGRGHCSINIIKGVFVKILSSYGRKFLMRSSRGTNLESRSFPHRDTITKSYCWLPSLISCATSDKNLSLAPALTLHLAFPLMCKGVWLYLSLTIWLSPMMQMLFIYKQAGGIMELNDRASRANRH